MYDSRSILTGRSSTAALLPPWARTLNAFALACTHCGDCASSCPTGVIDMSGLFPAVDFTRGECTFCGDCVTACGAPAFDIAAWIAHVPPWTHVAAIGDDCVARARIVCQSCHDECAFGAIRFRPAMGGLRVPTLDAAACTGCGACVRACPARAIALEAPLARRLSITSTVQ